MKWYIIMFRVIPTTSVHIDWVEASSADNAKDQIIKINRDVGVEIAVQSIISTQDRPKVEWDW